MKDTIIRIGHWCPSCRIYHGTTSVVPVPSQLVMYVGSPLDEPMDLARRCSSCGYKYNITLAVHDDKVIGWQGA
jgi:hypothetical protein